MSSIGPEDLGRRLTLILGAVALLAIGVPLLGAWATGGDPAAGIEAALGTLPSPVPAETTPAAEAGQFTMDESALGADPTIPGRGGRTLRSFYELRAHPGAPPTVPHDVSDEMSRTQDCGVCHTSGGWVPRYDAYAPVTPHAEFANCLQCHVPAAGVSTFRGTRWEAAAPPSIGGAALEGSPPPIPHEVQMRERCVACHAGPSAVVEVRTDHPQRIHCQQCHVPQLASDVFERAGAGN